MVSKDISSYKVLLTAFEKALEKNLIHREEIVNWADQIILNQTNPDYFFLEVSLSRTNNDLLGLIHQQNCTEPVLISGRVLFGFAFRRYSLKKISAYDLIMQLRNIALDSDLLYMENDFIYGLDHLYDYITYEGKGNILELEWNLIQFLKLYNQFTVDNYDNWEEIDSQLEINIQSKIELLRVESFRMFHVNPEKEEVPKKIKWWKFW